MGITNATNGTLYVGFGAVLMPEANSQEGNFYNFDKRTIPSARSVFTYYSGKLQVLPEDNRG